MRISLRTRPKIGFVPKRRRRKKPGPETLLHVEWLSWLVDEFGSHAAAEWQEAPVSFDEWKRARKLAAHEAA